MFNKICVLGCGLIGSSLLRAIEKKKLSKEISAFDKSKDVSTYLVKNFSFNISKSIDEAVKDSDLVIISSPLSSYKEILLSMKSSLKKNVILTDTGSAKKEVNKIINNLNLDGVNWIAIQLTPSKFKLLIILFTSFFADPVSVKITFFFKLDFIESNISL